MIRIENGMAQDLVLTPQQIIRKKAAGEPIDPGEKRTNTSTHHHGSR